MKVFCKLLNIMVIQIELTNLQSNKINTLVFFITTPVSIDILDIREKNVMYEIYSCRLLKRYRKGNLFHVEWAAK